MAEFLNWLLSDALPAEHFFLCYLAVAAIAVWFAFAVSKSLVRHWQRKAIVCFTCALFFSPSIIGAGHGFFFGPAWITALQQAIEVGGSTEGVWVLGVIPILVTASILFVGSLAFLGSPKESEQSGSPKF